MKKIKVYHPLQMAFHKIAIVLTSVLILTGLPFFSKDFSFLANFIGYPFSVFLDTNSLSAGLIVFRTLHWICGFILLFGCIIFALVHLKNFKDLSILPDFWGKEAIEDGIKQMKLYYIDNKEAKFGKLNMGQKAATWAMIVLFSTLFLTGVLLVLANVNGENYRDVAFYLDLHVISFVLLFLVLVAHAFFALLPKNINAYKAMFQTGELDEEFVKKHHFYWYEKLKRS